MKISIKEMTIEEKLMVMEEIWDDLCHNADNIPSPAWHGDELAQREAAISSGKATFTDWDTAKKKIRETK